MRRTGLLILAGIAACSASPAPIVTRGHAIDADTVSIPVRLKGVDAFELRQQCQTPKGQCWPCGRAAQNFTAAFVAERTIGITLESGASFDRSVGTVSAGSEDLGLALILAGHAIPLPQFLRDDPDRLRTYTQAYDQARRSRRGGFAGQWTTPQRWRQGHRLVCERGP